MKYKRVVTIVLDSVGIGEVEDSLKFGDQGVNTLGNISKSVGLHMPNMEKLGLGNIANLTTIKPVESPQGYVTKMIPKSSGKDTLAGHWEMMGVTIKKPFKVYIENGFDDELVQEFSKRVGRGVLANVAANGMQIINEYYDEHMSSGNYILYTSVDSTFQLAAHEKVIPLDELYEACEIARELTKDEKYNVARVIARPFVGGKSDYRRTPNRKDYALDPPGDTVMVNLEKENIKVIGIGKINDIFNGIGVSEVIKTKDNMDGVDKTIDILKSVDDDSFIFVNLVDFDSQYGHSRDVTGYKNALEEFDKRIPEIIENIGEEDLLVITADHGNDPTYKGNDHTREAVPLIVYSKNIKGGELEVRETFEDLGETIADNFNISKTTNGKSFLKDIN